MKIGIITIQKSEVNYGASLQSFALWRFITDMGYDCEIIDLLRPCHFGYKESSLFQEKRKPIKRRIKEILSHYKSFWGTRTQNGRLKKFEKFNKSPHYSKTYSSVEELYAASLDYDVYVTGSDQVWNPLMPFVNAPYFLEFAPIGKKRVSYASSFGIDYLPDDKKTQYRNWLLKYNNISTREESGAHIVEGLIGVKPKVVLDPVFLISDSVWRTLATPVAGVSPQSYLLLYMLKYDEAYMQYASNFAKKEGLVLYVVLSDNKIVDMCFARQLVTIGPSEWMWLIDNAKKMLTSSFHGTAFSCIFNTPTKVLLKRGAHTNDRIYGLLSLLDYDYTTEKTQMGIDIITINSRNDELLISAIRESKEYLKNALQ